MSLISFHTLKISENLWLPGVLGVIERDQWHEMGNLRLLYLLCIITSITVLAAHLYSTDQGSISFIARLVSLFILPKNIKIVFLVLLGGYRKYTSTCFKRTSNLDP